MEPEDAPPPRHRSALSTLRPDDLAASAMRAVLDSVPGLVNPQAGAIVLGTAVLVDRDIPLVS